MNSIKDSIFSRRIRLLDSFTKSIRNQVVYYVRRWAIPEWFRTDDRLISIVDSFCLNIEKISVPDQDYQ